MKYIDKSQKVNIPLYKYFRNIDYAKDTIINSRIHLDLPETYNDVYDCAFALVDKDLWKIHYQPFFKIKQLEKYYSDLDCKEIEDIAKKNLVIGEIID